MAGNHIYADLDAFLAGGRPRLRDVSVFAGARRERIIGPAPIRPEDLRTPIPREPNYHGDSLITRERLSPGPSARPAGTLTRMAVDALIPDGADSRRAFRNRQQLESISMLFNPLSWADIAGTSASHLMTDEPSLSGLGDIVNMFPVLPGRQAAARALRERVGNEIDRYMVGRLGRRVTDPAAVSPRRYAEASAAANTAREAATNTPPIPAAPAATPRDPGAVENFDDAAWNRAITDHATENNLDHIQTGRLYLSGEDPALVRQIDERADAYRAQIEGGEIPNDLRELTEGSLEFMRRMRGEDAVIAPNTPPHTPDTTGSGDLPTPANDWLDGPPTAEEVVAARRSPVGPLEEGMGDLPANAVDEVTPERLQETRLAARREFEDRVDPGMSDEEKIALWNETADRNVNDAIDAPLHAMDEAAANPSNPQNRLAQAADEPPVAANEDAPVTVGELPANGLAPALVSRDKTIYVGRQGDAHINVVDDFPDVEWGGGTGFVTPDGQFLNRTEALAWTKENGERIRPSENMGDELDALDYRDQSRHVPPVLRPRHFAPDGEALPEPRDRISDLDNFSDEGSEALQARLQEEERASWGPGPERPRRTNSPELQAAIDAEDRYYRAADVRTRSMEEDKRLYDEMMATREAHAASLPPDPPRPPRPPEEPPVPPSGGETPPPPNPPEPPAPGGTPPAPPEGPDVVTRLTRALQRAERASGRQAEARTIERRARLARVMDERRGSSGEEGLRAELGHLKGELPRQDFEGVRDQFTQEEVDSLFNMIRDHPSLSKSLYAPINARVGLAKLLDGQLPTASEIQLLSNVFSPEFVKAALKHRSRGQKIHDFLSNAVNLPRSLMSSYDLSASFRQGVFLVGRKEFWKGFASMFRQFGSETAFDAVAAEIRARPTFPLMEEAKLSLTTAGHDLTNREEAFMSQWAEKIPVVGRGVRASERAFVGFLNKVRADVFDDILRKAQQAGVADDPKVTNAIASFVNNATGRGSLGALNRAGPMLNGLFFSPRLIASRLTLLNPAYYISLPPVVRREAIKSLLSFGGLATTILSAFAIGGAEVGTDPRNSDFGKIRTGDTRFDILGGFQQYIVLASRLLTNEKTTGAGEVRELGGRFGTPTRLDVTETFLENKLGPVPSYIADYLRGKNPVGQPFDPLSSAAQRMIPLFAQDAYDVIHENGPMGVAMAVPGLFGVGVGTYPSARPRDAFGLELPHGAEETPEGLELRRLAEGLGPERTLIGRVARTIGSEDAGTRRELTDEEYATYERVAGEYTRQNIHELQASPDYANMSDDDKRREVRRIVRDSRAAARDDLFTTDEGNAPETPPSPATSTSPPAAPANANDGWLEGPPTREEVLAANPILRNFRAGELTSGRRTEEGNDEVGGVNNSDHLEGNGADFIPRGGQSMAQLAAAARRYFGPSARVINEGNHVHISAPNLNAPYFGSRGVR